MTQEISQCSGSRRGGPLLSLTAALLFALVQNASADVVEMVNGDRYVGNVLSLDADKVILHSEFLGEVRLPRVRVAVIAFGANATNNLSRLRLPPNPQLRAPSASPTNAASNDSMLLRQLAQSTNLIRQVQRQFLGDAAPESNDKFNELLGGLMTGKLSVDDIRAQASSAAEQLRALKRESGEQGGWMFDTYLGILDHFLKETEPASGPATNALPKAPKPVPQAPEADQ
jgi:hypothetical protein